jgi:hypothetical protein
MSVLSTTARQEYFTEIADSLPLPVLDKLEHRERRLTTAVEAFNALRPGDAYEGRLAVRIVLCGAHAVECLREAAHHRDDDAKQTSCRAQAASMMRAESAAKRTLEREQKLRLAGEAVAGGAPAQPAEAAALPRQAEPQPAPPEVRRADAASASAAAPPGVRLADAAPPPAPQEHAAVAPPRLAAANPEPSPVPAGSAPPAAPVPPPSPKAIAQAEAFVRAHALAAAQIRHDRGVTPRNQAHFRQAHFGRVTFPTDPAVIDALIRGTTKLLLRLDDAGCETLDAAA